MEIQVPKNGNKRARGINLLFFVIAFLLSPPIFVLLGFLKISGVEIPETIFETAETSIDSGFQIELSDEQVPAIVEIDGFEEEVYLPTVDEVDGGEINVDDWAFAQGAYYPTESWQAFADAVIDRCVIEGNIFGAQCVSLAQAFWSNYAGRNISVCGTGAARGIWYCADQNAGAQFVKIENSQDLRPGDWIIFDGGQYGHVGMAVGSENNGYIALLGENQGGKSCGDDIGGSAANIININLKTFLGAFRPTDYVESPKTPETGVGR